MFLIVDLIIPMFCISDDVTFEFESWHELPYLHFGNMMNFPLDPPLMLYLLTSLKVGWPPAKLPTYRQFHETMASWLDSRLPFSIQSNSLRPLHHVLSLVTKCKRPPSHDAMAS